MAEARKKGRKRNIISNKQRYESAKEFAVFVQTGGMKRDLAKIKVIPQQKEDNQNNQAK